MWRRCPERSYVGGSDDSILPDHAWLRLANPSWGLRRRCQPESPVCSAVSSGSLCNDCEPMWSPPQRGLSGQIEQSTKSDGDDESRQVAEPQEPTSMRKRWASASLLLQASRAGVRGPRMGPQPKCRTHRRILGGDVCRQVGMWMWERCPALFCLHRQAARYKCAT